VAFDLSSSSYPLIKLKVLVLQILCDHETFGIEVADCAELTRAYLSNMVPISTGAALRGWRRNYAGAYIVELDDMPVFNSVDFTRVCAAIRVSFLTHPKTTISFTIAPIQGVLLRFMSTSSVLSYGPCSKCGRVGRSPLTRCRMTIRSLRRFAPYPSRKT
jgi:hypothetical protein